VHYCACQTKQQKHYYYVDLAKQDKNDRQQAYTANQHDTETPKTQPKLSHIHPKTKYHYITTTPPSTAAKTFYSQI
jgi:hypothetical protein